MVDTVYSLPIGGPVAQVGWLGPKVGGHLASFLYSSREPSERALKMYEYITVYTLTPVTHTGET